MDTLSNKTSDGVSRRTGACTQHDPGAPLHFQHSEAPALRRLQSAATPLRQTLQHRLTSTNAQHIRAFEPTGQASRCHRASFLLFCAHHRPTSPPGGSTTA
eukprot:3017829-Pleurochrysis_carterae.AAC.1